MPKISRQGWRSLLLGVLVLIVAITFSSSWLGRGCLIHSHTGILCPGCGGTRAAKHLLGGEWAEAAKANLLIYAVLTAIILQLSVIIAHWGFGRNLRGPLHINRKQMLILLAVVILFTALRNVPAFSTLRP